MKTTSCPSRRQGARSEIPAVRPADRPATRVADSWLSALSDHRGEAYASHELAPTEGVDLATVEAPAGTVRILFGVDVPSAALAQIAADWSLVTSAQKNAPELSAEIVAAAMERLGRLSVNISGVAVAEPLPNPLAAYLRRAA